MTAVFGHLTERKIVRERSFLYNFCCLLGKYAGRDLPESILRLVGHVGMIDDVNFLLCVCVQDGTVKLACWRRFRTVWLVR